MSILDQLGGEKIPGAFDKNSVVGETVTGTIVKADIRQTRDYMTGDLETWEDGNPKNQVRIILDVNGTQQAVYVKTWGRGAAALKEAVRAAGMTDLDVGATFTATFARTEPSDNPKFSDTKIFEYALTPASSTAGMFTDTPAPAAAPETPAAQAIPPAQPAAAAPAAPAAATLPDQIKGLAAQGLTHEQIAAALANNPMVNEQLIAAVLA